MRCIHCEQVIKENDPTFIYPVSKATAHVSCVSQESVDKTDALIVARRNSNHRRVYSTGVRRKED